MPYNDSAVTKGIVVESGTSNRRDCAVCMEYIILYFMSETYTHNIKENPFFIRLGFQMHHTHQERNNQNVVYQDCYCNRLLESFDTLFKHLLHTGFQESTNKPEQILFSPFDRASSEETILSVCVSVHSRLRTKNENLI